MPFTEQQVQIIASGNAIIKEMYQRVCENRMDEEDRKREVEINAQRVPTDMEPLKAMQDLALYNPYHNIEIHPREHIPRDPQPFYTKFLNKRNKRNKRK